MIAIVDYGVGNIRAFIDIYKGLNLPVIAAKTAEELKGADRIVLPGVGAFDWAMDRLMRSGMRETLDEMVLERDVPVLGVCVGMQLMANGSEEGELPGLGWIDGYVKLFDESTFSHKTHLPHMGWNDLTSFDASGVFKFLNSPRFYFLHSYYFSPINEDNVLATTHYGTSFASAVGRKNIIGTQFHPEKSHSWGITLLSNFAREF